MGTTSYRGDSLNICQPLEQGCGSTRDDSGRRLVGVHGVPEVGVPIVVKSEGLDEHGRGLSRVGPGSK